MSAFDAKQREKLYDLYQKVKNESFHSFPQEFKLASINKGIRKQIDDEFIEILDLSISLKPYYEMLSKESGISLQRL